MSPVEPVTTTRTREPPCEVTGEGTRPWGAVPTPWSSETEEVLEGALLDAGLDRGEVPRGIRTVHEPVVVGQGQVAHRADRDDVLAVRALDDRGALDDRARREDRGVADVDDRGVDECPARTGVRDRERCAAQLVGLDLVLARAAREVGDRLRDAREVEV